MWWRQSFAELLRLGFVNGSKPIVQECLRFCFMRFLREELEEFKNRWNCHLTAKSGGSTLPRGRPNSLYFLPELYETESFRKGVDLEELEEFNDPTFIWETDYISDDFKEFVSVVLKTVETTNNPQSVDEGLHLYFVLLETIATYS